MSFNPIVSVENLTLNLCNEEYHSQTLLNQINFNIAAQETFALLGESGSGKTITALSILRLLPGHIKPDQHSLLKFEGKDLLSLSEIEMRQYRGKSIAMIFQEPANSLNPIFTIGEQINEALLIRRQYDIKNKQQDDFIANKNTFLKNIKAECLALLAKVKITDPSRVYNAYPHQLSGGMKQRAMIAMALAGKPKLLIADEPTTALDVTTQAEILKLLKDLQQAERLSILFITHDIAIASDMANRFGIMHQGKLIEVANAAEILADPKMDYTQKLFNAKPHLKLEDIEPDSDCVLKVKNLMVSFPIKKGLLKRTTEHIRAVDNVSFSIRSGETLALMGESGCGKTTLAKAILALLPVDSGETLIENTNIYQLKQSVLRQKRAEFQMVFQDPISSLNPRMRVKEILKEGMLAQNIGNDQKEREDRINELLKLVGLKVEYKYRFPHQFSGGQRQRICIARALGVGPRLLVCDEPTSSLDVSVEAKILDLLIDLQNDLGLAYLFITHNFRVVRLLAHTIAVMQNGKIVEYGPIEMILNDPQHEYTKKLLMSEPKIRK